MIAFLGVAALLLGLSQLIARTFFVLKQEVVAFTPKEKKTIDRLTRSRAMNSTRSTRYFSHLPTSLRINLLGSEHDCLDRGTLNKRFLH